jgi:hypothetical protein
LTYSIGRVEFKKGAKMCDENIELITLIQEGLGKDKNALTNAVTREKTRVLQYGETEVEKDRGVRNRQDEGRSRECE